MKNMVRVAIAAGVALASSTVLAQSDYDDRWYVSAFGGFAELDEGRADVDNTGFWGIGIGKFLSESFSLELEADRINSEFDAPFTQFDDEFNAKAIGLVGRYHWFDSDAKVRPFIGLGLGATYRDSFDADFVPGDKDTAIYLQPVVGLKFLLSEHLGARIQAAWRNDLGNEAFINQNRFDDFLISAGITYSFGSRSTPPPPPPPAPPPPPPEPGPCDLDDDGDGVPNCRDNCANTCSGAAVDQNGCEVELVIDLPNVNFDFDYPKPGFNAADGFGRDNTGFIPGSMGTLDSAAATLQRHSRVNVEVAGHTDALGSDDYNLELSDRRSSAVREYLITKGISGNRLTSRGYGESRPIATNDTQEGRDQNRRVELVITSGLSACDAR